VTNDKAGNECFAPVTSKSVMVNPTRRFTFIW
jgi:hypothetical protein